MDTRDVSKYFKIDTCFLCDEKTNMEFICVYNDHLYRALICFNCMAKYENDGYILLAIIQKANKLHEEREKLKNNEDKNE